MNDLVEIKSKGIVADSLTVAEVFGKEHYNVVRDIEKLLIEIDTLNFEGISLNGKIRSATYIDSQGRKQKKYDLDRDTFSLLVMGFTGKKALTWKIKYIEAFNHMEAIVQQRSNSEWLTARSEGKMIRRDETDVIKDFILYALDQGSKSSNMYYKHFTSLTNNTVGVVAGQRENLSHMTLSSIKLVENKISELLVEAMEDEVPYKEVYQNIKVQLATFDNLLPKELL